VFLFQFDADQDEIRPVLDPHPLDDAVERFLGHVIGNLH
jgi:hypothetical protein